MIVLLFMLALEPMGNIHQPRTFSRGEASSSSTIYKHCPICSHTSVSRLQLLIIYSSQKILLSHLSLFVIGDSDIGSYKFSKFHVWCSFPFFHSLQQSSKTYTLTVYRSICSIVISFKNLQTC